jgi:hypothetical protein
MIDKLIRFGIRVIRFPFIRINQKLNDWRTHKYVTRKLAREQLTQVGNFDFNSFKATVMQFVNGLRTDESHIRYRYSAACSQPTLYSSVYACMTISLLGELKNISDQKRKEWIAYFDSFQNEKDGLFYDPVVDNELYKDTDWWGARHLAVHMISGYKSLGARPRFPFSFLKPYYNTSFLNELLNNNKDKFSFNMENDFDNKLMNILALLQYQRDFWNDREAGEAVYYIQQFLLNIINPRTGIWGDDRISDPYIRSRKIQFAYHLLPAFFYDGITALDHKKIAAVTLETQNKFGGYGAFVNSSACEDIDSVDILIRVSTATEYEKDVANSLKKGFTWIMANQVEDGGFVFRLNEKFTYGHPEMSSSENMGAIFPTWFRTLSIAYLANYFKLPNHFVINRCPGYEY